MAPPASADVSFTVDSTADGFDDDVSDGICHTSANTCSLRAALVQSSYLSGQVIARIVVPAGTYVLTRPAGPAVDERNGDLDIAGPPNPDLRIEVAGAGAATTIIDANSIDRVLNVGSARIVSLFDLTLRNGFRPNVGDFSGGGISNRGSLTLTRCVVERNRSVGVGGGIVNLLSLTVVDSRIDGNSAFEGGGILNAGTLLVLRSTLAANSAYGGGAVSNKSRTTIRDSTLSGNSAGQDGGAVENSSEMFVVNSTISGNVADRNGGGIATTMVPGRPYLFGLYNSTVVDNDADHDRDETGGVGGGVFQQTGNNPRFIVVNSIIARNTIFDAPIEDDCNGVLEAYGRSLLSTYTGCSIPNIVAVGIVQPASIGPLQDNGGATATHSLLAGSAAVDGTVPSVACIDETGVPLSSDQRGAPRTAGSRCDVGAYESGSQLPGPLLFANGFE